MNYFVDPEYGSDSNSGLAGYPWQTLQHALTNVPNNSTLTLKGTFLEGNPTMTGKSNVLINTNGPTEINGYVPIDPGAVGDSGSYYTFNPGVMIGMLANQYISVQRFNDRPHCFVPRAANLAEAQTTPNRWWQDQTTKEVTFTPHASQQDPQHPSSDWCYFRTGNGFRIADSHNICVKGPITLYGWLGGDTTTGLPTVATGYGVLINSQSYNVDIFDVEVRGYGGHALGGVDDVFGIRFHRCVARTGRRDANSTTYVLHSDGAGVGPNVLTMMRCISCIAHCDGLLDCTGAAADAGAINGFYTHGGGAVFPRDIEFNNCEVYVYDDTSCRYTLGAGRSDQDVDFDEWDARTYPIRYVDCVVYNGSHMQVAPSAQDQIANVSYTRCYITLYKNSLAPVETYGFNIEGVGRVLFDTCVVVGSDNDLDTAGYRLIHLGSDGVKVSAINTAFINVNPNSATAQRIFYLNAAAQNGIKMRGCVSIHITANSQLIANAASFSTSRLDVDQCWTNKITTTTGYCNGLSTIDSLSEWQTLVDTNPESKFGVDPQLITTDLQNIYPDPAGALVTTRINNPAAIRSKMGINGRAYSNNFGPWQWGVPGHGKHSLSYTTLISEAPPKVLLDDVMYVVYDGSAIDRVEFNSPYNGHKVVVRPSQGFTIFHTGNRITLGEKCDVDPAARYWIRMGQIFWAE